MGIQDRDYMKRRSEDDTPRVSAPDARLEAFFDGFLRRHPKFFLHAALVSVVLIAAAIAIAKLTSRSN